MGDVALFAGDADTALDETSLLALSLREGTCFVWNSITLILNLSQCILNGIIYLQFEHKDIRLSIDYHIGTTEDALDFGYVADTYPVVCTEIGYCLETERGAHVPVKSTDVYGEHITKYLDSKGISSTVWCFDPHWAPMIISDWDFNLTTQGRFFKKYFDSLKSRPCWDITGALMHTHTHTLYWMGCVRVLVVSSREGVQCIPSTILFMAYTNWG